MENCVLSEIKTKEMFKQREKKHLTNSKYYLCSLKVSEFIAYLEKNGKATFVRMKSPSSSSSLRPIVTESVRTPG